VSLSRMFIDADRNLEKVFSIYGDKTKEIKYTKITGYESSYLEHFIFEHWMDLPSVSAVKALQIASLNGIPIYDIDKSNIDNILPNLNIPEDAKVDIMNAVNRGLIAKVSESSVTLEDWRGVGYILTDPTTGSGSYLISGGFNGGSTATEYKLAGVGVTVRAKKTFVKKAAILGYNQGHQFGEEMMIQIVYITHYLSAIGYNVIQPFTPTSKECLIEALKSKNISLEVFYYNSDGRPDELLIYKNYKTGHKVSLRKDEIPDLGIPPCGLVHIDACYSIGVASAFPARASVGWSGLHDFENERSAAIMYAGFAVGMNLKESLNLAKEQIKKDCRNRCIGAVWARFTYVGDSKLRLKGNEEKDK
ncbi:MAG: hypothetical protein ABIN61_08560, partial [candidate division WOR-3 bacterium]